MDDATAFIRIFGDHVGRSAEADRLTIRDAGFIADLQARVADHAARARRNWSVAFSPTRTDDLTERSLFRATLTSAAEGERRLSFAVARDWVEIGDGAMESSVRWSERNLDMALENAFRRVVSRSADRGADERL